MNPAMFGNLGQFNYGSLGDSPALMNMAQFYPEPAKPPSNPFIDLSRYVSALVNAPWQDNTRMRGNPMLPIFGGGGVSGDELPETYAMGGIRG